MQKNRIWIIAGILTVTACKKEAPLKPSDADENYLTVKDNPSDPVDHAIYQFYQNTGVSLFYNDTIGRKQVADSAGIPQYLYLRLAVAYSLAGIDNNVNFTLLKDKQQVVPMLDLLKNDVLPFIPDSLSRACILLVDSLTFNGTPSGFPFSPGFNSYSGFNTIAIRTVDPDTMSADARRKYVASVLGDLGGQQLGATQFSRLNDFYNISVVLSPPGFCYGARFSNLSPDGGKTPEDFGFIAWFQYDGDIYTPDTYTDVKSYVAAVINYTPASFAAVYAGYPAVIEKFNYIRPLVKSLGFQLPE
ncbi:MAG: hypothetical protein J0H74_25060 [Chitinophagaceae bacterium]|nr:hypothetical protein [Chitinophagaceae bacterium]